MIAFVMYLSSKSFVMSVFLFYCIKPFIFFFILKIIFRFSYLFSFLCIYFLSLSFLQPNPLTFLNKRILHMQVKNTSSRYMRKDTRRKKALLWTDIIFFRISYLFLPNLSLSPPLSLCVRVSDAFCRNRRKTMFVQNAHLQMNRMLAEDAQNTVILLCKNTYPLC